MHSIIACKDHLTSSGTLDFYTRKNYFSKGVLQPPKIIFVGKICSEWTQKFPLLFIIYITDLQTTQHTPMATFVDDTALISMNGDTIVAQQQLQNNLTPYKTGSIKEN